MIQNTVLETHQQFNLFPPNETIILGVSGGADSMALLHIMSNLREILNIRLHVATLNHGLRDEAAEEVRYVQKIAQNLDVPVTAETVDVHALSQIHNIGTEAAGRLARYDFFARVAAENGASIIATAHHADDQTETILLHLLRGAGVQGLVGMQAKSPLPLHPELTLVRPMLNILRADIDAYCAEHKLEPRYDVTNSDTVFLRNAIRHDILPRLRVVNPQIDKAFKQLADIVAIEQDFMQANFQAHILPNIMEDTEPQRFRVNLETFQKWHPAMQRRFILNASSELGAEAGYTHITQAVQTATKGEVGAIVQLTNAVRMRVGYTEIILENENSPLPDYDYLLIDREYSILLPDKINFGTWTLEITQKPSSVVNANLNIAPESFVILRTRKIGDKFQPLGMGGRSKTLKRWMIDHKIPQHLRDRIPLLVVENQIAAIILPHQWSIAEPFAINEESQYKFYFTCQNLVNKS